MTCSDTVNKILKIKENKIQAYISEENQPRRELHSEEEAVLNKFTQDLLPASRIFSRRGIQKRKKPPVRAFTVSIMLLHLDLEYCNLDCWQTKTQLKYRILPCWWFVFSPKDCTSQEEQKVLGTACSHCAGYRFPSSFSSSFQSRNSLKMHHRRAAHLDFPSCFLNFTTGMKSLH